MGERTRRIESLDVLRGIAILGILLMNIPFMGNTIGAFADPRLLGWEGADRIVFYIKELFVDGTQRGLLELLFGATAFIIASRSMRPDDPVQTADIYYRRTLWLVVFGVLHGTLLLWPGDILFNYGLAGLALFPLRRLRPRTLVLAGVGGLLLAGAAQLPDYFHASRLQQAAAAATVQPHVPTAADRAALAAWTAERDQYLMSPQERAGEQTHRLGNYPQMLTWSWNWEWAFNASSELYLTEIEAFFTMLIGMALFKSGVLQGRRSTRFYLIAGLIGYAVGLSVRWYELDLWVAQGFGTRPLNMVIFDIGRLGVTIGHLCLIHLLLRTGLGRKLLTPFQAAGRMALSCYIGQTLICQWLLFSGFGFGLWGRFGLAQLWVIAAAIIVVQLLACHLWLRAFAMGPLEWIWRRLTYGASETVATMPAPVIQTDFTQDPPGSGAPVAL